MKDMIYYIVLQKLNYSMLCYIKHISIICLKYVFLQSIVVYKDMIYCIAKVKLQHAMLYQTYKHYLPTVRVFAINSGI